MLNFDENNLFGARNNKGNMLRLKSTNAIDESLRVLIEELQEQVEFLKNQNKTLIEIINKKLE